MVKIKKVAVFLGDSKQVLKGFPKGVRKLLGDTLLDVQWGATPTRPAGAPLALSNKGSGRQVREIRASSADGWFRVIYIAKFEEAVYVLHSFQKKTNTTLKREKDLAKSRLRVLEAARRDEGLK